MATLHLKIVAAVLFLTFGITACGNNSDAQVTVITNASLIDGRTGAATAQVNIVIKGGVIDAVLPSGQASIPKGATELDASGKWVMPGIVDVHVHNADPSYLEAMLMMGVTTIHLMPNHPSDDPSGFMEQSNNSQQPTPRVHLSEMFTKAFPDNLFPGLYEFQKPQGAQQARDQVQALANLGYKSVKIVQDDSLLWAGEDYASPMFDEEELDAIVETARANNMRVFVHSTQASVTRQTAFADALLHGTMDTVIDEPLWRDLKGNNVVWAPVFTAPFLFGDFTRYAKAILDDEKAAASLSDEERAQFETWAQSTTPLHAPTLAALNQNLDAYLSVIAENTKLAVMHDIPVAVGTDGGPAGFSTHLEMEFLSTYGLSQAEVLVAATWGGALALGVEDTIGVIERGRLADLVVLNSNPLDNIRNTRDIAWVMKGGVSYGADNIE